MITNELSASKSITISEILPILELISKDILLPN